VLKEYFNTKLLQPTERDETLASLHNVEQNVETTVEKNIVFFYLLDSLVSSSTISTSPIVCENNFYVVELPSPHISSPSPVVICKTNIVNLCFKMKSTELIDEVVIPNMPDSKNIVVDIQGFSTHESTPNLELISID
jgi:hypothetical protein